MQMKNEKIIEKLQPKSLLMSINKISDVPFRLSYKPKDYDFIDQYIFEPGEHYLTDRLIAQFLSGYERRYPDDKTVILFKNRERIDNIKKVFIEEFRQIPENLDFRLLGEDLPEVETFILLEEIDSLELLDSFNSVKNLILLKMRNYNQIDEGTLLMGALTKDKDKAHDEVFLLHNKIFRRARFGRHWIDRIVEAAKSGEIDREALEFVSKRIGKDSCGEIKELLNNFKYLDPKDFLNNLFLAELFCFYTLLFEYMGESDQAGLRNRVYEIKRNNNILEIQLKEKALSEKTFPDESNYTGNLLSMISKDPKEIKEIAMMTQALKNKLKEEKIDLREYKRSDFKDLITKLVIGIVLEDSSSYPTLITFDKLYKDYIKVVYQERFKLMEEINA